MADYIYHVVEPSYFKQFEDKEEYYPARFEEEGFIHNCFEEQFDYVLGCLLYTSPSPRDQRGSRMPSSA